MAISVFDFAYIPAEAGDRRERPRFPLACALRLVRDGVLIGESRTQEINCEGFSCSLPAGFVPGDIFECEIDLPENPWSGQPSMAPLRLHCRAMVTRIARQAKGVDAACRLLGYAVSPARLPPNPALTLASY